MITAKLKQILTDAGFTHIVYEQAQLANLYLDRAGPIDLIGLIIRPDAVNLEVKANAIPEHYAPITIEVLTQARLEDKAEHNEADLQTLLDKCKEIIVRLIADAEFRTLQPVTVERVLESKYDGNLIGWSLPLDLYYLHNETRVPCL